MLDAILRRLLPGTDRYGPGRRMMSVHAEAPAHSALVDIRAVIDHIEREPGCRPVIGADRSHVLQPFGGGALVLIYLQIFVEFRRNPFYNTGRICRILNIERVCRNGPHNPDRRG